MFALLAGVACGDRGGAAMADLEPLGASGVRGTVNFVHQKPDSVRVEVHLLGLSPGLHGIHVHEHGDCAAPDGSSAGDHFNPTRSAHGGPDAAVHHVGDLGNVRADGDGRAALTLVSKDFTLDTGTRGIVGRSVIVHAQPDDLHTDPAGNAGARVACGVIRATSS